MANLITEPTILQHKMMLINESSLPISPIRPSTEEQQPNQDEFVRFFNQSLDLLCIASFDGYYKCVNPAWTSCLGWTPEALEATPFLELVHPDDYVATKAEIAKLNQGTETILFENRYRHQDGSYRWLSWSAQPEPDHQQIYAIARDISQQKRLEAEVLEIADKEKQRLGRELHDGLCQTLAGIAALSTTLSKSLRRMTTSTQSAAASAEEISGLLNDAITEARNLAHGLDPLNMARVGLNGALQKLALNIQQLFQVKCVFNGEHVIHDCRDEVSAHLFRIAQEAVNNAIIHGHATRVDITLSETDNIGRLCICDDGVGILEDVGPRDGIGMHTMAYRAKLIGASLKVQPASGHGTVVHCHFPFDENNINHEATQHVASQP